MSMGSHRKEKEQKHVFEELPENFPDLMQMRNQQFQEAQEAQKPTAVIIIHHNSAVKSQVAQKKP